MGIVFRDQDGHYGIGPLSEEQYSVILGALELASAWTGRGTDVATARALRAMIPPLELIKDGVEHKNPCADLHDSLPPPGSPDLLP